jgi:hypothetical protein
VRDSVDPARTGEASAADDASLRAALANLQQASPPEIRATTDEVLAALDRVIQVQKESATAGTAIDPASAAEAKLAAIDAGVQRASIRLTNYAKKACGIDLGAAPTTVPTTRPIGPVPADNEPGTVEPGVSASLVTPS